MTTPPDTSYLDDWDADRLRKALRSCQEVHGRMSVYIQRLEAQVARERDVVEAAEAFTRRRSDGGFVRLRAAIKDMRAKQEAADADARIGSPKVPQWVWVALKTALDIHGHDGLAWLELRHMAEQYGYHGHVSPGQLEELGDLSIREIARRGIGT